ncbi:polyribonucleotide nucleotidyltransferase [bacterium (Candidatus Gribaldobacteria) CG_4_9_14_3_um_filter_36_15]|uniref:Polyribonucleotide nucleotidyltransferase n=1 Tax=bacterium (Candidatus Gribaldobacteria) CG_4_9_14_3_um_filter_36_15 TaxID=2014269 RepID=A0A2M7ZW24_9BACT|nr:MAG: polyribonucleotide nucleotidyltransferase [bacterium (Candidatus Gribaldobacteria) CG_4_9_14_3_um_filter_36_15]
MTNYKIEIANRILQVETDKLAERASGCVLLKYGDTSLLVVSQLGEEREGVDFFPLTCQYEERYYAAGRIRGSRFMKREGRPSDRSVLIDRIIDRAIRPRFPEHFKREIQVVATCLSFDKENDPAVLGLLGSSLSLLISEIPWQGPVAAVRIGRHPPTAQQGGKFILNPNYQEREEGELDLLLSAVERPSLSGMVPGELLLNMIEGQGNEVKEDLICQAFEFAKPFLKKLIDFQKEISRKIGKEKIPLSSLSYDPDLKKEVEKFLKGKLEKVLYQKDAPKTEKEIKLLKENLLKETEEKYTPEQALDLFEENLEKILKENILKNDKRPDGRKLDEIREVKAKVGLLPRVHGSAFFSRGLTNVLSVATLGSPHDQQLLDEMELVGKKRFIHYYNFPPYSSGEVRPMRGPGRREIGHGVLAEKALVPLMPNFDDFPYTVLVVSEVISSNGSTSMASVSGASLALMDAGIPIKRPAAGISIGLMEGSDGNQKLLTDIQGAEDSHGGMDFKVAGTEMGITALQMDVKVDGINGKILKEVLDKAKKARLKILTEIGKVISQPRPQLSKWAPRIYVLQINPDKIGEVIGPGGKIINEIIESCGVTIDIEDSGKVFITAEKEEAAKKAIDWVRGITKEVKIGEVFQGKVKRILDFGAFVEILPGQEGLVHISQFLAQRINKVVDVVRVGDIIPVKVIGIDEMGRINLSAKAAGFKPR